MVEKTAFAFTLILAAALLTGLFIKKHCRGVGRKRKVGLELDERTYRIIEQEARRRGLQKAEELILFWIIEKAMTEIRSWRKQN